MRKMATIAETATFLGVSKSTLRRWEREGRLLPDERTAGGQRRYDLAKLRPNAFHAGPGGRTTIAYARVSSPDQKADLERQGQVLTMFCSANGWSFEILSDLGSGMHFHKRGLRTLLDRIIAGDVERLVLTHRDRLLRFGAELVFAVCEIKEIEVVIINQGEEPSFEEELAQDVLEIITVFSARLYGSRNHRNKQMLEKLKGAVET
ncbi:MAG: IS607 family transposase [Thermaerobacter sp.]|nr:IS607 family transposase [Thermaerobacter sp.]